MFIAALFTIARTWKQPKCPLTDEWIKKMWHREARRTTILQPVEQKPHSQKERQDEKAEGYVPDEGTR